MSDPRAHLPSLTELLRHREVVMAGQRWGRERVLAALRAELGRQRAALVVPPTSAGGGATDASPAITADEIVVAALAAVEHAEQRRLRPVINATGVVLHTNLGRAQLSSAAVAAVVDAAGATNLETDLTTGDRGGRTAVVTRALSRLTGAEDAVVVNNGAAALVLVLATLAAGHRVVVSRGELVEIGGSFRLPDIIASAGVELHEIGTTNRTHLRDYEQALRTGPGAVLRVHPSNFRIEGFATRPEPSAIAAAATATGVPFVHDVGSGLLSAEPTIAPEEPSVPDAVAAGADLVLFSGDKLLGGPQAGAIVGRADLVERCRRHPLMRALRLDKLRTAALEASLADHEAGRRDDLPTWAMLAADVDELRDRAAAIAARCGGEVVASEAVLGGGSVPGHTLPSAGVALPGPPDALAHRLRTGDPAVQPRIVDGRVVADLRAVPADQDEVLAAALAAAVTPGPPGVHPSSGA